MKRRSTLSPFTLIVLLLVSRPLAAQTTYTPYTVTAFAGQTVSGGADGAGAGAMFFSPRGVAVDTNGYVYVADTFNSTIRKITPAGVVTTWAGSPLAGGTNDGPGAAARFYFPSGLAVDKAGVIYVADEGNHTIRKITPDGMVSTLAGQPGFGGFGSRDGMGSQAQFRDPFGVAVDNAGNVFVAELYNIDSTQGGTIRRITPDGMVTTLAGSASNPPASVDGTGAAARFYGPAGLTIDSAGNLFAADGGSIRKITPDGVVTTLAGLAGSTGSADGTGNAARFFGSTGVAVDAAGNIYVADEYNSTIRKVSPAGTNWAVTTVAGAAGVQGAANGTGSAARFYLPFGIAVDGAGTLYIADSDSRDSTIRKAYPGYPPLTLFNPTLAPRLNGGQFGFSFTGPAGQTVVTAVVEASSDLLGWMPLATNSFSGTLTFTDPQAGLYSGRFYRARFP